MTDRSRSLTPLEALTPPPWASLFPARSGRTEADTTRLLDGLHQAIRTLHYSRRTERAYRYWIRRFVVHYTPRDPARMGADEIRSFLSHLAVNERVSASTQSQALCALLFLYGRVLGVDLGPIEGIECDLDQALPCTLQSTDQPSAVGRSDRLPVELRSIGAAER